MALSRYIDLHFATKPSFSASNGDMFSCGGSGVLRLEKQTCDCNLVDTHILESGAFTLDKE